MVFDIVVTQKCNLDCKYCFERKKTNNYLNIEDIPIIVAFLKNYISQDFVINREEIKINFNGGEPLLNFPFIKAFILETHNFVSSFSISTNFTLITKEMMNFFNKYGIIIQISIDGSKNTNKINRVTSQGKDYYNKLIENIKLVKSFKKIRICASMVYTPKTISILYRNVKFLYNIGFRVINAGYTTNFQWPLNTRHIAKRELKKISNFYIKCYQKRDPFFYSLLSEKIDQIMSNTNYFCGAFIDEITLLPTGEIIPCLGFMGNNLTEQYICGYWTSDIKSFLPLIEKFRDDVDKSNQFCKECELTNKCHKSCLLDKYISKNNNTQVSAMNCLTSQISFIEAEKIILKLIYMKNNLFLKKYKKQLDRLEVKRK